MVGCSRPAVCQAFEGGDRREDADPTEVSAAIAGVVSCVVWLWLQKR